MNLTRGLDQSYHNSTVNTSGKHEIESTVHYRNEEVEIIIKKSEFDISGKSCLKQQNVFLTHTHDVI